MSYSGEVLFDTPLAYYRLDETSGTTLNDSSGNSRTGTYSTAPTTASTLLNSTNNASVDFLGNHGPARVPVASWMNVLNFTAEGWFQADTASAGGSPIISRIDATQLTGSATRMFYVAILSTGVMNCRIRFTDNSDILLQTTPATHGSYLDGKVHHAALTWDGTWARLYMDGVEVVSSNASAGKTVGFPTVQGLAIGGDHPDTASIRFDGRIDEVAFYGTALSAARILAHYNAAADPTGITVSNINTFPAAESFAAYWSPPLQPTEYDYRIDGGSPVSVTTPYAIPTGLSNALHTLEVRPRTVVGTGNWSSSVNVTTDATLTFNREILADNPITYVPLDETTSNYTSWPRGYQFSPINTPTRNNAPLTRNSTNSASPQSGSGIATYAITTPTAPPFPHTNTTLEFWFTIPDGNTSGCFLGEGSSAQGFRVYMGSTGSPTNNGRRIWLIVGNVAFYLSAISIPNNGPSYVHHVAFTKEGTTVKAYYNGSYAGSFTVGAGSAAATTGVWIGSATTNTQDTIPSTVKMDSVAIYSTALTPDRLYAHYNAGSILSATPDNLTPYRLNNGLFVLSDPVPGATRTDYSLDGGSTWITSNYAEEVTAKHPAVYWRLDETSGTSAADASGNSRNGTYSGSYSLNQTAALEATSTNPGKSIYTPGNGGASLAAAGLPTITTYLSAEAWIKPDDVTGTKTILSRLNFDQAASTTHWSWSLHLNGSKLETTIYSTTGVTTTLQASPSLTDATWYHVAMTYDGETLKLYINGILYAAQPLALILATAASADFKVGLNSDSTKSFKGYIDEAAFYDYPMSNHQVMAHYQAGLGYRYNGSIISGLTNGSPQDVKVRSYNAYNANPTAASLTVTETPNSTKRVVVVDRFNRNYSAKHPSHADYALAPYSFAITTSWGITTNGFLYVPVHPGDNNDNVIMYVPTGTTTLDGYLTIAERAAGSENSGIVMRYASISSYFYLFGSNSSSSTRLTYIGSGGDLGERIQFANGDVLRLAARDEYLYGYVNGLLVAQPSENRSRTSDIQNVGIRHDDLNARSDNFVVYADSTEDYTGLNAYSAFLMKGRVTHLEDETYVP